MTNNGYNNGHAANDDYTGFTYELEEPIAVKGFSVTYDRKFNTGNFESLNPAITIWLVFNKRVTRGHQINLRPITH